MQSIQTRYIGPTNSRGARIKAYSEGFPRGITVPYEHGAAGHTGAHRVAAESFIRATGWFGVWIEGASADGRGSVYVCVAREHTPEQADRARKVVRALQTAYTTDFIHVREVES